MQAFRLICPTNNEVIFGVDNEFNNATLSKLNKGLFTVRPYNYGTPYYKNSKFAFMHFNGLKYFLFNICKFTYSDLIELENLGFKVIKENLECYSRGLSKLFCTYFDDEVVELKEELLSELFDNADSMEYEYVDMTTAPKGIIKDCKERFYSNIKFKK